jgi:hypothetical protein
LISSSLWEESAENRGILKHRLLVMGREGGEKGGVACFEDLGASIALADKGGVFVVEGEAEKEGDEAVGGGCRSGSRFRSDLLESEDAETTEAGREGDDVGVGGEGAEGGAEDEEGVLEMLVEVVPTAGQVIRPKAASSLPLYDLGFSASHMCLESWPFSLSSHVWTDCSIFFSLLPSASYSILSLFSLWFLSVL